VFALFNHIPEQCKCGLLPFLFGLLMFDEGGERGKKLLNFYLLNSKAIERGRLAL
jgi:hypothetical protein